GIRDKLVTGVQTCALPIYALLRDVKESELVVRHAALRQGPQLECAHQRSSDPSAVRGLQLVLLHAAFLVGDEDINSSRTRAAVRSEERRCRERGWVTGVDV